MKTGNLKPGMKVLYHGHLSNTPMTFYKRDDNPSMNRWYFKYDDGTITALSSHEVNKRIAREPLAPSPSPTSPAGGEATAAKEAA